jgi:hypothetical protein
MNLEMSSEEADLLKILLQTELEDKRVEMRHAKNPEFKNELQAREKLITALLGRL